MAMRQFESASPQPRSGQVGGDGGVENIVLEKANDGVFDHSIMTRGSGRSADWAILQKLQLCSSQRHLVSYSMRF
jgi:hypothetical protein